MCVCIRVSMHACTCICMFVCVYACMYVRMYVRVFVCMYACMHVCMYAYVYACTQACMYVGMYANTCMYILMYIYHFSHFLAILLFSNFGITNVFKNQFALWGGWNESQSKTFTWSRGPHKIGSTSRLFLNFFFRKSIYSLGWMQWIARQSVHTLMRGTREIECSQ